ncbi:cytochrome b [Aeromonas bivalvium]|uniref:cytochrome b n=1 Tax=Aeromonas bivalvium TaxID=440079 RepID=UPI0038D24CF2
MHKYPSPLIIIHWMTVILVLTAYATSGDPTRGATTMDFLVGQLHVLSGSLLFILVLCRLFVRRLMTVPEVTAHTQWLTLAARAGHGLLYLLMLLTPVTGWLKLSGKVTYFDAILFNLPLMGKPGPLLHQLGNYHQTIGNVFITLVGVHAFAALLHHYYFKDNTLKKMLFR